MEDIRNSNNITPWRIVIVLICTGIVSSFQVGKIPAALPVFRAEFVISLFIASLIISFLTIIGATTGVVMGAFGDRIGYRRLISTGLSLLTLGCILGSLSSRIELLFLSRFIEGIGFFFTILSAPSLITRIADPRQLRLILGFWAAYMPSGIALMIFISPILLNLVGWRGLWFINGLICLLILVLFIITTRGISSERSRLIRKNVLIRQNIKRTVSAPGPLLLALCFSCYGGQWMALMNFLPTFFIDVLGNNKEGAAILTALAVVCNIPGNIFGGWLSHRNIPRWILLAFSYTVVALTTFGIYSYNTPHSARLVLLILFSFIGGIMPGTLLAGVPLHSPGKECLGTTNGLITQGSNLGTMLLPPTLAIFVSSVGDWNTAPWIFVITGSIGIILSLGIRKLESE